MAVGTDRTAAPRQRSLTATVDWSYQLLGLPQLTAVAITSGWAALTTSGEPFSLLSSLATVIAGSAFSLGVATAITTTGALAVLSAGLAYGVGT